MYTPRLAIICIAMSSGIATAAEFEDATQNLNINYARVPSAIDADLQAAKESGPLNMNEFVLTPLRTRGVPGVALLDYDNDGDLDVYVTNGPGAANSLLRNELSQHGVLGFTDVATQAGAALPHEDSTGVCFGDTDNDGDEDLLVLGRGGGFNHFLENQGDGTFVSRTADSDIGGTGLGSSSCSMGDVNDDGLLDIYVANAISFENKLPIVAEPFALNHPNALYINQGDNRFADETLAAGIGTGPNEITWATAVVDYDQDGDLDIIEANDQAVLTRAAYGGVDRGSVRIYRNRGNGVFDDATPPFIGNHMGLDFADFDHDGVLDMFVSDGGDYMITLFGLPYTLGDDTTRWYLGDGNGGFVDPGVGSLVGGTFAWGVATEDYDSDGDTDIVHVGGLEGGPFVDASNPGTVLTNDGYGNFSYDSGALNGFGLRRNDHGLAMGDLDHDGDLDIVTVSDQTFGPDVPLVNFPFGFASPWDPASFIPVFGPDENGDLLWTGVRGQDGTLAILLNKGSEQRSVSIRTLGSAGLLDAARTPRDGIGALVHFKPRGKPAAIRPVIGGASYSSQHDLRRHFGLGRANRGRVDVVWPGGVKNRLYNVRRGERVDVPEIPCSYDTTAPFRAYARCVVRALRALTDEGLIERRHALRLAGSALVAYFDH